MTKSNPKVSLIISCYNSEKYIAKTLDTVCNQSFNDYEVICVNDGSTDHTLSIIEEYAKKYKNIKVITKKNDKGRTTLKRGLQEASGSYICAIDNDDFLSPNYLEKLYNAITKYNADMSVCGFQREDKDNNKVFSKEMNKFEGVINCSDDYGKLLEINTSLWNKMIKKEVFKKLLELEKLTFWMDMLCLSYMYVYINKIAFTKDILYFYQVRDGSSINSVKSDYFDNIYNNLLSIKDSYKKNKEGMLEWLNCFSFLHIGVSLLYRIFRNNKSNFNEMYKNNIKYLNNNFPMWYKNKYVSLKYVIKYKGRNFKLFVCKIFYKLHLLKMFIRVYDFITRNLKFDIKW